MLTPSYLAGFFDGEGSTGVYRSFTRGKWYYTWQVSFSQNNLIVLRELQLRYGGRIRDNGRSYQWHIHGRTAVQFLTDIASFVIQKQAIVGLVLTFSRINRKTASEEDLEWFYEESRRINGLRRWSDGVQ